MPSSPGPAIEHMRPFLPARDFKVSQDFYRALGFAIEVVSPRIATASYPVGTPRFLLQDYYQKDYAENLMMQIVVPDIEAWWQHVEALSLPRAFGVQPPKPPVLEPWGMRVGYLWDPAGVLWHIAARQ